MLYETLKYCGSSLKFYNHKYERTLINDQTSKKYLQTSRLIFTNRHIHEKLKNREKSFIALKPVEWEKTSYLNERFWNEKKPSPVPANALPE